MIPQEVVGFTERQREWILERDGHRCQFHEFRNGKWRRCNAGTNLQVHHIIPRGWAKFHLPVTFQVNGPLNGITLCKEHHVGECSVHPDTFVALVSHKKTPESFQKMMHERKVLNSRGDPYWNTKWDWMLGRIAKKQTGKFSRTNPYPVNGNRGNTGRVGGMKHTRNRRG